MNAVCILQVVFILHDSFHSNLYSTTFDWFTFWPFIKKPFEMLWKGTAVRIPFHQHRCTWSMMCTLIATIVSHTLDSDWLQVLFVLKDPLFFAFGCLRKLLFVSISSTNWSFLPFSTIFFANSCFKALKIKSNILTQCLLILKQNLASHPVTPHFLRLCSHQMPQAAFGSVSLTPISIWYWSAPCPEG